MAAGGFLLLLTLFFFSGACGLTYQALWLRLLSLTFGVTVYAASTVLAAFMAGLALGSAMAGPVLSRVRRPLRVFGIAEILIGVAAVATPLELQAATTVYRRLYEQVQGSLLALTGARLVTGFVVLLVPTMLMGLTLPALTASSLVRGPRSGARIGALYAVNTAGAVMGAVITGFYSIGGLGIRTTFLIAAVVNVGVGCGALLLERLSGDARIAGKSEAELPAPVAAVAPFSTGAVQLIVTISGFAALALEIVWFRMLVQYLNATSYAFTTMVAMVLAGIAIGGGIAARVLRRQRSWTAWLFVAQAATALAVLVSAIFLAWSYNAGWRTSAEIQASAAAILLPAVLMGIAFPIAIQLMIGGSDSASPGATARRVGRLYALNVAGAIAGALVAGFVLLPLVGTRRALVLSAALYVVGASVVAIAPSARRRLAVPAVALVMAFTLLAARVPDPFSAAYARRYGRDMREFWRDEGAQTAVSVHASTFRRSLYLDGLHQANDTPDMVHLHRVIGHLPMVLHRAPKDALVIGLGGGATAGAVSQHAGARVQIVELSESVRRAAPFFTHISYDVLHQPNVRMRVDDGRNFLLLSGERFDVITADIIQPNHAGAGNVYSREYFTLVRKALRDDGVALQWIGHRPPTMYGLIARTFQDVFPQTTLWFGGALMVGSVQPLKIDPSWLEEKRRDPRTRAALDAIGLTDFATLSSWFVAGDREFRQFVGPGPVLTDDHPLLEYHRSLPYEERPIDLSHLRGDINQVIGSM